MRMCVCLYGLFAKQVDKIFNPFTLLVGPCLVAYIVYKTTIPVEDGGYHLPWWNVVLSYCVWLTATRTAKLLPHFWYRPQDVIYVPAFILFGYYFAIMKVYALLTLHEVRLRRLLSSLPSFSFSSPSSSLFLEFGFSYFEICVVSRLDGEPVRVLATRLLRRQLQMHLLLVLFIPRRSHHHQHRNIPDHNRATSNRPWRCKGITHDDDATM